MQPGESSTPVPPRGRQPLPRGRWQSDGVRPPLPRRPMGAEPSSVPAAAPPPIPPQSPLKLEMQTASDSFTISIRREESAPAAPTPQPKILEFTPTSTFKDRVTTEQAAADAAPQIKEKKRRKLKLRLTKQVVLPILVAIAIMTFGGGAYAFVGWQSTQKEPSTILSNALTNSLSQQHMEITTTRTGETVNTKLDLSQANNPVSYTETDFQMYGSAFKAESYGTTTDGFVKYTGLPSVINAQTSKAAQNVWVQVRGKEKVNGLDLRLAKLSDPRHHMFGPVLFGNYTEENKQQLVKFVIDHQIYKPLSTSVKTTELDGVKVYEMPVKLDVGFLKVALQSAAVGLGYTPQDVQTSVNELESYKDGQATMYISTKEQHIVRFAFTKNGEEVAVHYAPAEAAGLPSAPQAQQTWQAFAPTLWQMKSQAAAKTQLASLDNERKADIDALHTALASYAAQKGSFPTQAQLADANWQATILGVHVEQQRDPLAVTIALGGAPKTGSYVYLPTPASGKGACDQKSPCLHYRLIATLSNGQQYAKQDP